jgi:hypothetical protein
MNLIKHLKKRGVSLKKYNLMLSEDQTQAYFFIYNLSQQIVGYQKYNPNGIKVRSNEDRKLHKSRWKYFTWATKQENCNAIAVWGLEHCNPNHKTWYVTEGIFDAVKLINAGYSAVAILTCSPSKELIGWFSSLPQRFVGVLDNDGNNDSNKLTKVCDEVIVTPYKYKDLGDMPQWKVNWFMFWLNRKGK